MLVLDNYVSAAPPPFFGLFIKNHPHHGPAMNAI